MRRSCSDLAEIISEVRARSCDCESLSMNILYLVEVLFGTSLKGPCITILKMLCIEGAGMEVLLGCS